MQLLTHFTEFEFSPGAQKRKHDEIHFAWGQNLNLILHQEVGKFKINKV